MTIAGKVVPFVVSKLNELATARQQAWVDECNRIRCTDLRSFADESARAWWCPWRARKCGRDRIDAWRASGLKSEDFCAGGEFAAGLLRHWAWRLGKTRRRRGGKDLAAWSPAQVQLARVVRVRTPSAFAAEAPVAGPGGLHVEIGRVRVVVPPSFDGATLSALLDVLERRADAHGRGR
jgi:hypothetical protein